MQNFVIQKIHFLFRCRKCDHVLQQYCYRLSLEIDTNLAVLPVTIVGNCLDKYFGVKSDEFYKYVKLKNKRLNLGINISFFYFT